MRNSACVTTSIVIILAGLLFNGCGGLPVGAAPIDIAGLVIYNNTPDPLYDIKLKVEKTGTVVTCNFIPSGRNFSTEFPLKRYQGNSVNVSWQQDGLNRSTDDIYADIPEDLGPKRPVFVAVIIQQSGDVVVRLTE